MKIDCVYIKGLLLGILLIVPVMAMAVTQKEMEQARTIAAKAYLRYANDGSGYLDDVAASTMEELEAALKTKEKENIKAFKAIPVPSDYKDWNKEKLVEYWAVTAFQNKELLEKGRGGRIRARSQINKMEIGKVEETAAPKPQSSPQNEVVTPESLEQTQDEIKAEENKILAEEEAAEPEINVEKARSDTWVYIMILAILVAIVVALVVYAANVMKRNGKSHDGFVPVQEGGNEDQEHYEALVADKDTEIAILNKKLESASRQNSELKTKIEALTAELSLLKNTAAKQGDSLRRDPSSERPLESRNVLRSIYLGRANSKGIFIRADRTLNVGHSVFVLDTSDGFSGTFRVADSSAAWSLALSNPREYLESACTGYNLEDTEGASKIVTESSGTAVFEGGCWRVIRKARVRYE